MANEQNLIPNSARTPSERRELAAKAGKASGKARREKADFKRKCQIWMDETIVAHDENGKPLTGSELMIAVAGRGIMEGNTSFWQLMRDTAGYKPVDKVVVAEVEQATIEEVEGMVLGSADEEQAKPAETDQGADDGQ